MPNLEPGERVLARASGPDGEVSATNRRLIWPDGSIHWYEIERASWDGDAAHLLVTPVATSEHAGPYRLVLNEPTRLVDVVREQVTASVVITRHVPLSGEHGVQVTGRRRADGSLVWNAVVDAALDLDDPQLRTRLDAAITTVRSEIE
ncbi:hypothetical protein EF847_16250 [Actinobacteria bacterium YIM 96077]|nr:hypothetical protein EF847_16250 [Actinobacteria bacterium YIM 96077]